MSTAPRTETSSVPTPAVPTPAELLRIAEGAAAEAADYLRSLDRDHISREYKTSSQDIVTDHDRRAEDIIVAALRRDLPGCRIVGEEGGERPADVAGAADAVDPADVVTFYVDPIDGTSNFAAGLPLFCVSIGVAVGEELVAGVIDAPILGEVFTAADGPMMVDGVPVEPRATRAARDALLLSGFPGHRIGREMPEQAGRMSIAVHEEFSAVRHLGTAALELAYVAAGRADATALASINPWDIAAGFHLVHRAGGSVRTWPGTGPADRPGHLRPAYAACTGPERLDLLDALLDEVQALRADPV